MDLPVNYKTAYDAGSALLQNMSTEGCAFSQLSLLLAMEEKILVSIELPGQDFVFQAQGKVVRVEKNGLAGIHFTLVEPEDQSVVRKYFAKMMGKK